MTKRKTPRLSQCAFRFTRRRAHRVSDSKTQESGKDPIFGVSIRR
jgi:hypothetical protein